MRVKFNRSRDLRVVSIERRQQLLLITSERGEFPAVRGDDRADPRRLTASRASRVVNGCDVVSRRASVVPDQPFAHLVAYNRDEHRHRRASFGDLDRLAPSLLTDDPHTPGACLSRVRRRVACELALDVEPRQQLGGLHRTHPRHLTRTPEWLSPARLSSTQQCPPACSAMLRRPCAGRGRRGRPVRPSCGCAVTLCFLPQAPIRHHRGASGRTGASGGVPLLP